ncbi:MAG: FecR family protein [Pyrinomonadaceae bacterium MAG19_C2-C3]|nr:FecR family protein [Pyrinomonadaceae bacterium MAG19_C2-C3]
MLRHLLQNLNSIRGLSACLACAFLFAHASINQVAAQSNSPYVVSAKAGGINFVSGDVHLSRAGGRDNQPLTSRDSLDSGDVVSTGATGRLEVLLMPGSFLRVAENTQIAFKSATDELQFNVTSGTIIVEASGVGDDEALMKVGTPRTVVSLLRSGIYRITVAPDGSTNVAVRKGRAELALNPPLIVKGNNQATVGGNGGATALAKLAKNDVSEFESWSKQRAEQVAINNRKIQRRALRSTLAGLSADSLFARNRSAFGLWVRDGFTGSYAFLPFYSGWSSPYGSSYRNYLWTGYGYGYGYGRGGYYPYPTRGGNGSGGSNPNPSDGGTRAKPPGRDFGGRGRSPEGERSPQAAPSRMPEPAPRSFPSRSGDSMPMRKARPIEQ